MAVYREIERELRRKSLNFELDRNFVTSFIKDFKSDVDARLGQLIKDDNDLKKLFVCLSQMDSAESDLNAALDEAFIDQASFSDESEQLLKKINAHLTLSFASETESLQKILRGLDLVQLFSNSMIKFARCFESALRKRIPVDKKQSKIKEKKFVKRAVNKFSDKAAPFIDDFAERLSTILNLYENMDNGIDYESCVDSLRKLRENTKTHEIAQKVSKQIMRYTIAKHRFSFQ